MRLESGIEGERRPMATEVCWERVRQVEAATGQEFGEVVHQLRLELDPAEIPDRLGVSRHFLYTHFGWAMDKVAYVERRYGAPLGFIVAQRRAEGVSMAVMAREWGLVVTTLYNSLRRVQTGDTALDGYGHNVQHRTLEP